MSGFTTFNKFGLSTTQIKDCFSVAATFRNQNRDISHVSYAFLKIGYIVGPSNKTTTFRHKFSNFI